MLYVRHDIQDHPLPIRCLIPFQNEWPLKFTSCEQWQNLQVCAVTEVHKLFNICLGPFCVKSKQLTQRLAKRVFTFPLMLIRARRWEFGMLMYCDHMCRLYYQNCGSGEDVKYWGYVHVLKTKCFKKIYILYLLRIFFFTHSYSVFILLIWTCSTWVLWGTVSWFHSLAETLS